MLALFMLILTVIGTQSLRVFDCNDPTNDVRQVNLIDVEECPHVSSNYNPSRRLEAQVLRADSDLEIKAYRYV